MIDTMNIITQFLNKWNFINLMQLLIDVYKRQDLSPKDR